MASASERSARRFVYEHVFLPAELPQSDHDESGAGFLLKEMSIAAQQFYHRGALEVGDFLRSIAKWVDIFGDGTPCAETIIKALKNMGSKGITLSCPYEQSNCPQTSSSSTCDHRMLHF